MISFISFFRICFFCVYIFLYQVRRVENHKNWLIKNIYIKILWFVCKVCYSVCAHQIVQVTKSCDNWVWKLSFLRYMTVSVFKKAIHLVNFARVEKRTKKIMFLSPNEIVVFCFKENLCRMSAFSAQRK